MIQRRLQCNKEMRNVTQYDFITANNIFNFQSFVGFSAAYLKGALLQLSPKNAISVSQVLLQRTIVSPDGREVQKHLSLPKERRPFLADILLL